MADQLRMDVRSLEIDLHYVRGEVMVCHGRGEAEMHAGCTAERSLEDRLPELSKWLDAHHRQVVLLYLEEHLGEEGRKEAAQTIRSILGDRLLGPGGSSCTSLPLGLTRREVREAGKQVVIVGRCGAGGAWPGAVFSWEGRHRESRPRAFAPTCGPDHTRADYDSQIIRYFEDSTVLTATLQLAGKAEMDDGLTPETTAAMVRCGVDLFGFDQLMPDDGRLDALVWSWAPHKTKCAALGKGGYWRPEPCGDSRPFACRSAAAWFITGSVGRQDDGDVACAAEGGAFEPPRTGFENHQLALKASGARPWLAYTPPGARPERLRR